MLVKNYMTTEPITISPKEDVQYAFYLLKKHEIRQMPVTDNDSVLGIITERDLRMVIEKEYGIKIESAMSRNLLTVTEEMTVEDAAKIIHDKKYNALPVVNDKGSLVGIITVTDVINGLLKEIRSQKNNKTKPDVPNENFD